MGQKILFFWKIINDGMFSTNPIEIGRKDIYFISVTNDFRWVS